MEVIIENAQDFVNKIRGFINPETRNIYPLVSSVCDGLINAGKGCACSRSARQQQATNQYKELPAKLPDNEKTFLKEKLNASIVIFKDGGNELGRI